jgi:hypothetical protein
MSSIPLAANQIQTAPPPSSPLDEFARIMQIRGMQGQQQLQQTENQGAQLGLQEAQLSAADDQKWRAAMQDPSWDGSTDQLLKNGLKLGVGPKSYGTVATTLAAAQSGFAKLGSDQLKLSSDLADHVGDQLEAIQSAKPEDKLAVQLQAKQNSTNWINSTPGVPPQVKQGMLQGIARIPDDQYMGDDALNAMIGTNKLHSGLVEDALKAAQTGEASGKGQEANVNAQLGQIKLNLAKNSKPGDFDSQIDQLAPPNSPLNAQAKAMVNGALSRGDVDGAKQALDQTFQQVGAIGKETNPAVISARAQEAAQTATAVEKAHQAMYPAALAGVQPQLIQPATSEATKADQAFTQAQQAANDMQDMVKMAKGGNKIAYAYSPVTGVLQINVAGQTKRINTTEIEQYGGAGSALDRIKGFLGKQESGASIPDNVLNDMASVSQAYAGNAQKKYQSDIAGVNSRYGAKFQPMNIPSQQQNGGGGPVDVTDPRGVTHRFPNQQAADNFRKQAGIQ